MANEKTDVVIFGVGAVRAPGLEFLHLSMMSVRKESRRDV